MSFVDWRSAFHNLKRSFKDHYVDGKPNLKKEQEFDQLCHYILEDSSFNTANFAVLGIVDEFYGERQRQIRDEGFTQAHDDNYDRGQLAMAAATYCLSDKIRNTVRDPYFAMLWPWAKAWWKPRTRRRDLVRAGALLIAEIERLDRAGQKAITVE